MKKKILIVFSLIVMVLVGIVGFYFLQDPIVLKDYLVVEINESYNPFDGIEKMNRGIIEDVKVDDSQVKINEVGSYEIIYSIEDKQFNLLVEVIDSKKPVVTTTKKIITDEGMKVDVEKFIKEVQDDSPYEVSFLEDYQFNKAGSYEYSVVVKDSSGNTTTVKVPVEIREKDVEVPIIEGKEKVSIIIGDDFDPYKNMSVSDNRDDKVELKVVSNNVNSDEVGTYEVVYEASDYTGNKATFKKIVVVVKPRPQGGSNNYGGGKVVYLTFDDGPSYNTGKILEILDRYQVKATFFVMNTGGSYNHYITQAYQKGHTIGLHTYSHDYSIYRSIDTYFNDLAKIDNLVYSLTGYHSPYIRFPGGASNTISAQYNQGIMTLLTQEVQNRGYQYYDWNVDSMDASGNGVASQTIMNSACSASNGTVMILFHDTFGKDTTVEALPAIIEYYQNLGYSFSGINNSTPIFHHGVNN